MALDMNSVNQRLSAAAGTVENQVRAQVESGEELNDQQLIGLQMEMSRWTLITQLQSNMMKTISDSMKNTVSNIR